MGVRIPRITINADFGDDAAFGDLNLLSLGYGLHQAWVYAAMFGSLSIFGTQPYLEGAYGTHATVVYPVSIIVYCACLLFAAATDQRFLRFWISRKTLAGGAVLASLGTTVMLIPPLFELFAMQMLAGVLTGLGSSMLILFWGVAFARCDNDSIVLNTAFATLVSIAVYAVFLCCLPFPASGAAVAVIPLVELAILWNKTPASFSTQRKIPIFKPLPVNHAKFFARFFVPVLVMGLALGMFRQTAIQGILPANTASDQLLLLVGAGVLTVVILITILALGGSEWWGRFFRPLVPLIAVTMLFLPFAHAGESTMANLGLIVGFLCFEAIAWMFFGELAQQFRLSPILVFGMGRGALAVGILGGSMFPVHSELWKAVLPFGDEGFIVIMLLIMVVCYAMLPGEREIESIVMPCPLIRTVSHELDEDARRFSPAAFRPAAASMVGERAGDAGSDGGAGSAGGAGDGNGRGTVETAACATKIEGAERAAGSTGAMETADRGSRPLTGFGISGTAGTGATGTGAAETSGASAERGTEGERGNATAMPQAGFGSGAANGAKAETGPGAQIAIEATAAETTTERAKDRERAVSGSARPSAAGRSMPGSPARTEDGGQLRGGGRFRARCETVANTYLLSRRETEVMFFLAKGHNAAYLQEKLYISEGTAKTHIRHVYKKTNVHSQQELMRLIESADPTE